MLAQNAVCFSYPLAYHIRTPQDGIGNDNCTSAAA
jgi:hypothetical protein